MTLKCESSVKFLGVKIDENLTWRDHINTVENKIAKNRFPQILLGPFLNTLSHMYMLIEIMETKHGLTLIQLNWRKSKVNKSILYVITFNQSKTSLSEPFFFHLNVLNICQITIFQSVQFMYKKYSAFLPKTIRFTMPCLSHQFLLNKLLKSTKIHKNYTVCNIS